MNRKLNGNEINSKLIPTVNTTTLRFKEDLSRLLKANYGLEEESKVLALFGLIKRRLSIRNHRVLDFFKRRGLDFLEHIDISGGTFVRIDELVDVDPEIKSFLTNDKYTRKTNNRSYSRGYGYYFNLDGFENSGEKTTTLDSSKYFSSLRDYQDKICDLLKKYSGRKINEINWVDRKVLLILLEHYKNIVYFLINVFVNIKDKDKISQVLSLKDQGEKKYLTGKDGLYSSNEDFLNSLDGVINELVERGYEVVRVFSKILLNIDSDETVPEYYRLLDDVKINGLKRFFGYFTQKAKFAKGDLEKDYSRKLGNKLAFQLIRVQREQDNPLKMLLTAQNIVSGLQDGDKSQNIKLLGVLYGGVEMPFFMKYVMELNGFDPNKLEIDLATVSSYHLRNKKAISSIDNYPSNTKDDYGNVILLDDNIWNGGTLQHMINFISSKGRILESGVAEVGLRRKTLGELNQGSNLSFLLSKTFQAADVSPIQKSSNSYKTLVVKYIKKSLPGLVGKL